MHHSFVCGAISFEKVAVYTAALSRPCKWSQFVWILLHPSTSSRCRDGTTLYDMSSLSSGNFLQRSTFPLGHDLFIWCPKLWRLWGWAWRHFHVGLLLYQVWLTQESCCSAHARRQSKQSTKRSDASSWPACAQVTVWKRYPNSQNLMPSFPSQKSIRHLFLNKPFTSLCLW